MSRVDYDADLQKHNEVLRRAYGIGPNEHVLDIGCGAGQTTRDAARFATAGSVMGVDTSVSTIERARQLTETAGLHNVAFLQADAETHPFLSERFDIAISRFGTMFFAHPVTAFANIARALRPRGRLVMMAKRMVCVDRAGPRGCHGRGGCFADVGRSIRRVIRPREGS